MTKREKVEPYVLPFFVLVSAMWGPYFVWLAIGTDIEEYVWPNLLAAPLLAPALTFPGLESLNDGTVLMVLAESIIGEAIIFTSFGDESMGDVTWQHLLFCIGSIIMLAAMTTIGKRGRWWLAGVAVICMAVQVQSILALEFGF